MIGIRVHRGGRTFRYVFLRRTRERVEKNPSWKGLGIPGFALIGLMVLTSTVALADQGKSKGTIAFVANVEGNWDLFMMKGDGSDLVQLTRTPLDERAPSLSPDGEKIVYSTSDGALWILTPSTQEKVKLALPEGKYNHPAWSPDGISIVYTAYTFSKDEEDADLWMYSLEEKKPKQFLTQTGVQDYPKFSPKGDRLLYTSSGTVTLFGSGFTVIQQLWVASLYDGKVRQLLLTNARDTEPAWSPDGKWIAFSSDQKGYPDLWMVPLDGGELVRLTEGPVVETHPTWSPDGQEIAYVAVESGQMELRVLSIHSREVRKLMSFGDRKVDIRDPHWR